MVTEGTNLIERKVEALTHVHKTGIPDTRIAGCGMSLIRTEVPPINCVVNPDYHSDALRCECEIYYPD